jgi:hypothetical protein
VLVAPQPRPGIAVELLVLAAISGTALLLLDRRAGHDSANVVARYIKAASPNMMPSTTEAPGQVGDTSRTDDSGTT